MALILTITNAGRAALRNADGSGTRAVRIAAVGFSAAALAPTAATAALPGEIKRITTLSGEAVAADIIHLVVRDETMATYTVRSFALYLDDGTPFAFYGQGDPIIEKSAQSVLLLAIDVTLADIAASQITFGDANFLMPPATDLRAGLIELATVAEAKAGTDTTRAVTPATAKASALDWIGYTPANLRGDTFTGPVAIRHPDQNLGLMIAQGGTGYGFIQLGDAANPVAARTWHLGSQGDGSFALYQGIWGSGGLRLLVTSTAISFNGGAVWHAANDGAGSGLDADLLDGLQATQLLRADQSSTLAVDAALDFVNSNFARTLRIGGNGYTANGTRASVVTTNGNLHLDGAGGLAVFLNHYAGEGVNFGNGAGQIVATMSKAGALAAAAVDAPAMRRNGVALVGFDNDGAGSGLDADLLDGQQGTWYGDIPARLGYTPANRAGDTFTGPLVVRHTARNLGLMIAQAGTGYGFIQLGDAANPVAARTWHLGAQDDGSFALYQGVWGSGLMRLAVTATTISFNGGAMWHGANDGAGSGLDADLLDGQQGSWYGDIPARLGYTPADRTGDTFTGPVVIRHADQNLGLMIAHAGTGYGFLQLGDAANPVAARTWHLGSQGDGSFALFQGVWGSGAIRLTVTATTLTFNASPIWHAGNDGAGSGMDADLLDGRQGAEYALLTGADFTGIVSGQTPDIGSTGGLRLRGNPISGRAYLQVTSPDMLTEWGSFSCDATGLLTWRNQPIWHTGNDGAGSGLDADLLDGQDGSWYRAWANLTGVPASFPPSGHTHTAADLAGAFANASLQPAGYQVLPGGLILQWCAGATNATGSEPAQFVTFPISFPTACLQAYVSPAITGASIGADVFYQVIGAPDASGVSVQRQYTAQGSDNRQTAPLIFAIGY